MLSCNRTISKCLLSHNLLKNHEIECFSGDDIYIFLSELPEVNSFCVKIYGFIELSKQSAEILILIVHISVKSRLLASTISSKNFSN